MQLYEELQARGLIAQVTDEAEVRDLINSGKAKFYIGFDPTADSLHVGHFMALCLMKRLQQGGNQPIALIGGGTAYIGDPSGRTDLRSMMTTDTIQHNSDCFRKQMERFIEFGEGKAMMVNNADWLVPQLRRAAARSGSMFLGQQHAAGRVLQVAHGFKAELPGVQLHDHAVLRLLPPLPNPRVQPAVWWR
jgi:tyrosyl-tRNA synthetase